MPRYFFDTKDSELSFVDVEGMDFPDDAAAKAEASRDLGDLVRERLYSGRGGRVCVSIRNEQGATIYTMACTTVALQIVG